MASITYGTPEGGGFEAQVSGAPSFGSFGAGQWGNFDWIADLARRSAKNKLAKQEMELTAMNRAMNEARLLKMRGEPRPPMSDLQRFDEARQYMDRMEGPLDRYTMGNSPLGSNFRNFTGASYLSGVGGGFPNDWMKVYEAAAGGPSAAAAEGAGRNAGMSMQQQSQNDFLNDYLRRYGKMPGPGMGGM